jgi:hypothetical protein
MAGGGQLSLPNIIDSRVPMAQAAKDRACAIICELAPPLMSIAFYATRSRAISRCSFRQKFKMAVNLKTAKALCCAPTRSSNKCSEAIAAVLAGESAAKRGVQTLL